jgi:hypothetical protein
MKKLDLKLEGIKEMLTKAEMKKVNGGNDYCGQCLMGPGAWFGGCVPADFITYCGGANYGICYVC